MIRFMTLLLRHRGYDGRDREPYHGPPAKRNLASASRRVLYQRPSPPHPHTDAGRLQRQQVLPIGGLLQAGVYNESRDEQVVSFAPFRFVGCTARFGDQISVGNGAVCGGGLS